VTNDGITMMRPPPLLLLVVAVKRVGVGLPGTRGQQKYDSTRSAPGPAAERIHQLSDLIAS